MESEGAVKRLSLILISLAALVALFLYLATRIVDEDCREFIRSYELSRSVNLPASESSKELYERCKRS